MNKKTLLVLSLDDSRVVKVAEVISNKTCRKILELLSQRSMTESQISEELGVPISTIHYNIQKLLDSGLIESKEFHYSKKGREINHYTTSNTYIVIAQKPEKSLVRDFSRVFFSLAIALLLSKQLLGVLKPKTATLELAESKSAVITQAGAKSSVSALGATNQGITQVLTTTPIRELLMFALFFLIIYSLIQIVGLLFQRRRLRVKR